VIVCRMRNFGSGGAVLIVQNGRMLLGMVAVGSLWFVEEDRVGQTKPVRGETRNLCPAALSAFASSDSLPTAVERLYFLSADSYC